MGALRKLDWANATPGQTFLIESAELLFQLAGGSALRRLSIAAVSASCC
jgi:hypothetical protein